MAVRILDDSGVNMDQLLIEVLNSDSSFGAEMRNKISSTLDMATKKIEKGVGAMKFSTAPIDITSVIGSDPKEQNKISTQFQNQQKKILKWINEISMASNWKNLKKGANITDILGSDKLQNERFQKQYATLQKKMLNAIKANIPTKIDVLPKVATSAGVEQPTTEIPEEVAAKEPPAFGISGLEDKQSMLMPPVNKDFLSYENEFMNDIDKGSFIDPNKVEEHQNKVEGFLASILEKFDNLSKADSEGGVKGREAFVEDKPQPVIITEFGTDAVNQITNAMGGIKDEKEIKKMDPKKVGLLKGALKMAGIAGLLGLVTYLNKNPQQWEKIKTFFKDTFLPMLSNMVDKIPTILENIGKVLFLLPGFLNKFVVKPFLSFTQTVGKWFGSFIFKLGELGKWIGSATFNVVEWFKALPEKFNSLSEKISEQLDGLSSWISEKIVTPIKDFASMVWDGVNEMMLVIKDTILAIPDFIRDMFEKLKIGFINQLNKIPGVAIGSEAKKEKIRTKIAEHKEQLAKGDTRTTTLKSRKEEITKLESTLSLIELNEGKEVTVATGQANDFIYRPGQPIQKFSGSDVIIGAKEKLIVENKNLDKQMHDLTSVMETIKGKFDELIMVNVRMAENRAARNVIPDKLPGIANDIESHRAPAYDEAYNHKMRVWEILHGVA